MKQNPLAKAPTTSGSPTRGGSPTFHTSVHCFLLSFFGVCSCATTSCVLEKQVFYFILLKLLECVLLANQPTLFHMWLKCSIHYLREAPGENK